MPASAVVPETAPAIRTTACDACSAGLYSGVAATACAACPAGFHSDLDGAPRCTACAEGTRAMTAFLRRLKTQAPILLVEHDMDAVFALADRISVLVYGGIIASGSVQEVRGDPEVRRAYLGEEGAA